MSTDPEELFPPVPGGMVDTIRRQAADTQAQLGKLQLELEAPEAWSGRYAAVRVREMGAELARGRTFVISTSGNETVQLLGQDVNRKYAVLMALDEPVVVCFSQEAADDPRNALAGTAGQGCPGFVLPVNVPVPLTYQGVVWAVATSSTATRLSVMAFSFTEPEGTTHG
jgi:hypothetical protein